jgi:hypothetical protein
MCEDAVFMRAKSAVRTSPTRSPFSAQMVMKFMAAPTSPLNDARIQRVLLSATIIAGSGGDTPSATDPAAASMRSTTSIWIPPKRNAAAIRAHAMT